MKRHAPHFCLCSPLSRAARSRTKYAPRISKYARPDRIRYDVLWKVPGQGENLRLGLYVELPAGCANATRPRGSMVDNAFTERWTVQCPGGLTGGTIHIAGLTATTTDVLVRLERLDGSAQITRLTPSAPSFVVEAAPSALEVAVTYIILGVEHILTGIDHLLFVLALLIITRGGWRLVENRQRIHHRAQHHAFRSDAWLCARAASTRRGRHRAQHRVCRGGDHSHAPRHSKASRPAHRGSWRSPSG